MRTAEFDFTLPDALIALEPPKRRSDARLLHVAKDVTDRGVIDLPSLLRPGDLLVLNDTKVIPAALNGTREARAEGAGVDVEANLIERLKP
ncbi:MAG: S-adenosylmethionine:tRNA ribosyltransferase-isomerase, partial [Pseudomonadota bacterium]